MNEERRRTTDQQFVSLTDKVDALSDKLNHKLIGISVEQAVIKEKVTHILEQTTKTNGRVNEIEKDINDLDHDHRDLKSQHDAVINKSIGVAAGVGCVVSLLIKLFWR